MEKLHATWSPLSNPAQGKAPSAAQRNAARQAERRLVVHIEEPQRRWLRRIEAEALLDDVRLAVSAIVRLAIDELRALGVDWRDLACRTQIDEIPARTGQSPAERNAAQAERRLVVYLDEVQRRWLRLIEAEALIDDVRLSASAIVRLAIDELRARGIGWQGLADRLPEG